MVTNKQYNLNRLTNIKKLIRLLPVVLFLVLIPFETVFAGAPPLQWQKTFGGSSTDEGFSVQETSDGGFIIAGTTSSYGTGEPNVYLLKTEPNGNIQWQETFGGINHDYGRSLQQTTDGGYIIVGHTYSYGAGASDVYLIKTDPNGNCQWQKTFGGSDPDHSFSVQQTLDSGYIIAGYTFSYGAGDSDVYLIKTDPNGDSKWQKTFGASSTDSGWSVQQTTDGGYTITGYTSSYGAGQADVYLIKTDPNGNKKWQKTFGGSSPDWSNSVQQTSDDGYIIAGHTKSYGTGGDVFLIKTDPNGILKWQKTFGGSDYERGYSIQQTPDGGYIIAGLTYSFGAGETDVYLIKTDPNGNSQWQKTFGGSNHDYGLSLQQTSDGGYIIAGITHSYGSGWADVYLIKLCPDGTLSADFNCNGTLNLEDLDIMVDQWLQLPGILSADIAPGPGDGIVNFLDFAIFANDWLQSTIP